MPIRRNRITTIRRRGGMKRKRVYTTVTSVGRNPIYKRRKILKSRRGPGGARPMIMKVPVPSRLMTVLNYVEIINPSFGDAAVSSQYFRASIYDPNETAAGHQPLWHDQLTANYKNYKVHGMKYDIRITNMGGSTVYFFLTHTSWDQGSGGLNPEVELERRNAKGLRIVAPAGSGHNYGRLRGYLGCAKTENMSKAEYNGNDNYMGVVGFNPIKFSRLGLHGITRVSGVSTTTILVKIAYYVELTNRIMVTGS